MSKTIQFTDNSSNASTWLWEFGDGNTSTQQNPVHTFETFGSYMVRLTITDGMGNSDETHQFIQITDTSDPVGDLQSNLPPDPPEPEEEQEEQQTYSEPMPSSPPTGYNPQMGIFQTDALSPEGQWIWSGFGWVENNNYIPPETTTSDETDNTEETGNTQPTTQTYTLTGTISQFGASNTGPFSISNVNYPTLIQEISSGDTIIVNGNTNYIQSVSLTGAEINLALGLGDSMYGDSFSFSMTIVSEQIGLQPGDTSGNTGGDTGGDNGDTGDDGGDDYGGDDLPPGGGRPGITGP